MKTHLRRLALLLAAIVCSAAPALAGPPRPGRRPQIRQLERANLRIARIEMTYTYSSEFPTKNVFVTVVNSGRRAAGASKVMATIRAGAGAAQTVFASCPALLPGQSARVLVERFVISGPHAGKLSYQVLALADAKLQVSESNESDNLASATLVR